MLKYDEGYGEAYEEIDYLRVGVLLRAGFLMCIIHFLTPDIMFLMQIEIVYDFGREDNDWNLIYFFSLQ